MGTVIVPHPVKLITGIIASSEDIFAESERLLRKKFGPSDYRSNTLKFDTTDYYEKDMGKGLKRRFISFRQLIDPGGLADIKLFTNTLEEQISHGVKGVKRPVNIDPGYISEAKLILASTKNHCHRIYLRRGIYAEITLSYRDKSFSACDLTYTEYRSSDYISIFNYIRSIFLKQRQ